METPEEIYIADKLRSETFRAAYIAAAKEAKQYLDDDGMIEAIAADLLREHTSLAETLAEFLKNSARMAVAAETHLKA